MSKAKAKTLTTSDPDTTPESRCRKFLALMQDPTYKGHDALPLQTTTFTSCSPGHTEFALTVTDTMCNFSGNLHGGCAATILDDLTSSVANTLMKPGFMDGGTVTRSLTCVYLKPVPVGSRATVICDAVATGKRLVHFKGEIRNEKGEVAVTCLHDKVCLPTTKL